ncbi:hypothetical protein Tco_0321174 [Tanacetum coccineum]
MGTGTGASCVRFCLFCSSLVVIGRGIVGGVVLGVVGVSVSVSVISGSLLPVVERAWLDGLGAWIGVVSEVVWGTTSNGGAGSASGMFGKTASKIKSGLFDVDDRGLCLISLPVARARPLLVNWLGYCVTEIVAVPSLTIALKQ